MNLEEIKNEARKRVADLVRNFRRNQKDFTAPSYNETQARTDFITPLLEALGWDVNNIQGQPTGLREVIEEATVEVGDERLSKKPDYELRLARQRKLFVEAKKPHINIERDKAAAFQTRRYGYSASLPVSLLTNFYQVAIYDCRPTPSETDEAHVARLAIIRFDEFDERFDELWDVLSRFAIYSGAFDRRFQVGVTRQGAEQFDDYFLRQVRGWRTRLAQDIHRNSPDLSAAELTYAVQLFLLRIVFLRICEDRDIEKYETLKHLDGGSTFAALLKVLQRADAFYDSGLFRLLDDERLHLRVSDTTLTSIISELYYPQSPYTFAVVETEVLGEIYEQFLGEVITTQGDQVDIVKKPEVRESGGVITTPRFIVNSILERSVEPALSGKAPSDLTSFTVADICCGSGIFLLGAYEELLNHYLDWYLSHEKAEHVGKTIFETVGGQWRLTFAEKRRILLTHIYGVDIDSSAVEVARFSLLLKLIEHETKLDLEEFVKQYKMPSLPLLDNNIKCGNSLVDRAEWQSVLGPMAEGVDIKVNPFSWSKEFANVMATGGFDIIIGNPPYIRIQNMQTYSPEEVSYYKHRSSPYLTAHQDNFDKYALFIERSLSLVKENGILGVIVPHKFMTIHAGRALRKLIASGKMLKDVVHFGVKQIFGPGTSNYTCILILSKRGTDTIRLEQIGSLEEWRYGNKGRMTALPSSALNENSWEFLDQETSQLFARIRQSTPHVLGSAAEIFVGVQTSADDVYIIHPVKEYSGHIVCRWNNRDWPIERGILRPCLHDVSISAYAQPVANSWIIFPYDIVIDGSGSRTSVLIKPEVLRRESPGCLAYLKARRSELVNRNIVGGRAGDRQWYQYGRSQSLTKFDSAKIILPILSTEPRYAYDDQNTVVTGGGNGPYYMIRSRNEDQISTLYLLAVLNHPLSEAFVRSNTSPFRGGYYSHGKQFIENLPIPSPSSAQHKEITRLVQKMVKKCQEMDAARTPHARTLKQRQVSDLTIHIQKAVSEVFGLSESEVQIAEAVPIPS